MTDSLETQVHQSLVIGKTNKDVLLDQLDDLLERYLNTLHEYHRVTNELSKQLSEGYMSLAQANFHSSSSAIRYGQDFYDERMQAIRKVRISEHGRLASDRPYFSTYKAGPSDIESVNEDTPKTDAPKSSSTTTEPESEETTPNPDADGPSQDSEETKKETKKTDKPTDPLKWFGILVPPALRAAQSTFVETVEGPIPQLATIIKDMRAQEIEIGRVKKQIKKL